MKPIIGIVGRCQNNNGCPFIGVNDEVRNAVIKAGGIPILILPTQIVEYDNVFPSDIEDMNEEEKELLMSELKLCDGIIMPGGLKIFEYDKLVCEYAVKNNIPILGICLGIQIMSYYDSEYSLEDNDECELNHNQKGVKYVHEIVTKPGTILNRIFGDVNKVNSRHRQHIAHTGNYIISAVSEDGLIEGIEYPFNRFNVGIQWHPESMIDYDQNEFNLFKMFINESMNNSDKKRT